LGKSRCRQWQSELVGRTRKEAADAKSAEMSCSSTPDRNSPPRPSPCGAAGRALGRTHARALCRAATGWLAQPLIQRGLRQRKLALVIHLRSLALTWSEVASETKLVFEHFHRVVAASSLVMSVPPRHGATVGSGTFRFMTNATDSEPRRILMALIRSRHRAFANCRATERHA
jgi:hypothetical protein